MWEEVKAWEQREEEPEQGAQDTPQPNGAGASDEPQEERGKDTMTAADARALIDAARGEEVEPSEIQRQFGDAVVGEATRGW